MATAVARTHHARPRPRHQQWDEGDWRRATRSGAAALPEQEHHGHGGAVALVAIGLLGAGGLTWWLLHRHTASTTAKSGGAGLPDPLPCPAGWGGTSIPDCQPPPCGDPSNAVLCPPAFSGADLELALARLYFKTTAAEGWDYGDVAALAGMMNAPAPPPMGQVGYTRALDALEGTLERLNLIQAAGQ